MAHSKCTIENREHLPHRGPPDQRRHARAILRIPDLKTVCSNLRESVPPGALHDVPGSNYVVGSQSEGTAPHLMLRDGGKWVLPRVMLPRLAREHRAVPPTTHRLPRKFQLAGRPPGHVHLLRGQRREPEVGQGRPPVDGGAPPGHHPVHPHCKGEGAFPPAHGEEGHGHAPAGDLPCVAAGHGGPAIQEYAPGLLRPRYPRPPRMPVALPLDGLRCQPRVRQLGRGVPTQDLLEQL
mmetsp:Transcript_129605/g.295644  ORF Transcript_129605/g.295644 Transcript_129605/m.295644 type:complete len:237 (-) Transcript_129605:53-763(-)